MVLMKIVAIDGAAHFVRAKDVRLVVDNKNEITSVHVDGLSVPIWTKKPAADVVQEVNGMVQ